MSCRRCHGLMIREHLAKSRAWSWWWRCLNCGDLVDRVILRHRAEQAQDLAWRGDAERRNLLEWAAWMGRVPLVSQNS